MRKFTKRTATVAVAALVLTGTGVAYAYWTTVGAGTGSATVGAPVTTGEDNDNIILNQSSTNTGFYPGSDPQTISITATNPADFAQFVGEVTVSMAETPGCALSNWDLDQIEDLVGDVAANSTTTAHEVATLALTETGENQDGCQGDVPVLTFSSASGE